MRFRVVRRKMGHYIHRIGGNYQYGIGCIGKNFRHDLAEHGCIALQKLQPILARLLVNSGSYYYGATPFQIDVTACGHFQRSGKWDGVINIVSLGTTASFIFVNQHDFAAACITPSADSAVHDGALALAWTAIDAATDPSLRERLLSA